jgi:predicted PurR-regulated permease PerM
MDKSRKFYICAVAVVLLMGIFTIYITKEFLTTIFLSVFLAYMLNPVYKYVLRLTGKRSLSSFCSIILVFIVFVFIVFSALAVLSGELSTLLSSEQPYKFVEDFSVNVNSLAENIIPEPVSTYIRNDGGLAKVAEKYLPAKLAYYFLHLSDLFKAAVSFVLPVVQENISGFLADLPIRFAQFMVAIFFTYYLLIDGRDILYGLISELPEKAVVRHFLNNLDTIYNNLFNVYFITSMLSGLFATIGFLLIGTPYPVLLGAIIAIFTLLPMLGPVVVFLPMSIYYLLTQEIFKGVFILVFGLVVLMIIPENVLRPRLAMHGARIHPIITILAYTAPIFVVGIVGVILGPAVYGFMLAAYRTMVHLRLSNTARATTLDNTSKLRQEETDLSDDETGNVS